MNDDELAQLLGTSLDAQARASVPDAAPVPPPRFARTAGPTELTDLTELGQLGELTDPRGLSPAAPDEPVGHRARRLALVAAPLLAAAAVVGVVLGVVLPAGGRHPAARATASRAPAAQAASSTGSAPLPGSGRPVRIRVLNAPGATVGVGMPVQALFTARFVDARQLSRATTVTVNGTRVDGAWYFGPATGHPGYALEGHLRPQGFWPAHATVHVSIAAHGVTGGPGYVFANGLTLNFRTGAANIATVDDRTHRLTLVSDGRVVARYPVSLGMQATPTLRGTKVVMSKGNAICLTGPGYHECGIKYTQRLTDSGEYLVSAPWHEWAIGRTDVSTGCTDLRPADARALFAALRVGDVVDFPNATGAQVRFGDGFGDWDVPWSTWLTGGAVRTQ